MISRLWIKLKSFLIESKRVLKVTKKPSSEEFKIIVKVTSIGAAIIGFVGFLVQMIYLNFIR